MHHNDFTTSYNITSKTLNNPTYETYTQYFPVYHKILMSLDRTRTLTKCITKRLIEDLYFFFKNNSLEITICATQISPNPIRDFTKLFT